MRSWKRWMSCTGAWRSASGTARGRTRRLGHRRKAKSRRKRRSRGRPGNRTPWKDLRALEEAVEKALPDARRYWQEESGEDRCPGMWFDSGSLALDTQELLEIADSLGREQGLSVDMGELTVLLVLYGLTITAEIPRSLEDEEKLSFLDWAIQETGLPTEFTAERVMGSVRSQPFRYAMYDLRRQFFYWVQVLAERCDRDGDGERFRELFCTILEDAEEQWVENHPGGALRQGAEAFCRDALEEFARQLLRRRCAPF